VFEAEIYVKYETIILEIGINNMQISNRGMTYEELKSTHQIYKDNINAWTFFGSAYNGGDEFIRIALEKHPRETYENWKARVKDGFAFNYAAIVVDLFSFYLTEKSPDRSGMGRLLDDVLWKMFLKDCDLSNTNFDEFLIESQRTASIYGTMGVLVDKARASIDMTRNDAIRNRIYPYCSSYILPNILDWRYTRNEITNRPVLSYLKLKDVDNKYIIWREDSWEMWSISDKKVPILESSGENSLGEIPFVWLHNIRNPNDPFIGVSDIKEISRINASIIRNLSCGEEVIKFAGFPMLRLPQSDTDQEDAEKIVGHTSVLQFNPEMGKDGKPDWLESAVKEPIESIMEWIDRKIGEVYQMSHLSGIHAHEKSDQVRSGVALRYEFQQLGRVLAKKSENLTEAELSIIRLWLKWQNQEELFDEISVYRTKDFSVDDLNQNLQNLTMARTLSPSITFKREVAKMVAKKNLPDATTDLLVKINEEIDEMDDSEFENKQIEKSNIPNAGRTYIGAGENDGKKVKAKQAPPASDGGKEPEGGVE
jgi:hypothetical protein